MDITKLREFTGLVSWFEFYKLLRRTGQDKEVVELKKSNTGILLTVEQLKRPEVWKINLVDIKAAAFDEIMHLFPTKAENDQLLKSYQSNPSAVNVAKLITSSLTVD